MLAEIEGPQSPNRQGADSLTVPEIMAYYNVPGLSVAVIHDFAIHGAKSWGVADVETGAPATNETLYQAASASKPVAAMASLKAVQNGAFGLDQDINTILTSWKLPDAPFRGGATRDAANAHEPHIRHRRWLRFPWLRTRRATSHRAADPRWSATVECRPGSIGSSASHRRPLFRGGVMIQQAALTDAIGTSFADIMQNWVLRPIGMTSSTFEQPLPANRETLAARGHSWQGKAMGARWHVYPEQAAAGLWTTPVDMANFMIEVQRTMAGRPSSVLSRATMQEMVTPVGVGPYAVGFALARKGEGWYFEHAGSNWGYRTLATAHRVKGYGLLVMTNGDNGHSVAQEVLERVARAYGWDTLDKPILR